MTQRSRGRRAEKRRRFAKLFRRYGSLWGGVDSDSAEQQRIVQDCEEADMPMDAHLSRAPIQAESFPDLATAEYEQAKLNRAAARHRAYTRRVAHSVPEASG